VSLAGMNLAGADLSSLGGSPARAAESTEEAPQETDPAIARLTMPDAPDPER
jgi:hypothetical protein